MQTGHVFASEINRYNNSPSFIEMVELICHMVVTDRNAERNVHSKAVICFSTNHVFRKLNSNVKILFLKLEKFSKCSTRFILTLFGRFEEYRTTM